MGKIENDALGYSYTMVVVFGIFGNILVILSILRQKKNMLKNDYYFLVFHLAICDVAALITHIFYIVDTFWLEQPLSDNSPMITCNIYVIDDVFQLTGVGMMLIISLFRYRAIVHPLKPAISRRKLKVVCALVYLVGLIVGCGMWDTFATMLYKVEGRRVRCLSEILPCILDVLWLFRSNNIHGCSLL